ncbi:protein 5NUC-like [Haemaphysalis longicornis]
MYGPVVLAALCLLVHVDYALAYPKSLFGSSSLHLNILHTNDIHSRILESDQWGGECGERRRDRSKCFGGVARIAQKVREIKSSRRNTLFLNAGGFFQGTLWYSTLKHKIVTYAMSRMGYDVIGLGNNEFDDGPKELAPFVREMRKSGVAVVGTNVDVSREPHFKGVPLSRSHVITISGVRVALLAVVPKETELFSRPGHVRILPLAESINKEVWRLRQQGVKIFILISQAGFEADKRLAVACPELDVIVGGHSETFLYSGPPPLQEDARRVRGPYPFLVSRKGRRSCVIVQGYRYGKYLGNLEVLFNRKGEITHWRGRPILLDQSIGQDPNILRGLMPFKRTVEDALRKVVGSTKVLLEASHKVCRSRECNLGNLITDSFLDFYANKKSKVPHAWSEVNAAIINGGTVRESIRQSSKVTVQDLQRAMPIDNELVVMTMNGSQLHKMFEHAVSNFTSGPSHNGKFLQVSGMRVTYDLSRPGGWRVARLRILCANCSIPRYEDVHFQKRYTIVTTSFIANGGDGFKFDQGVQKRGEGVSAFYVFTKYFTKLSPIKTAEEGRIVVKNAPPRGKPASPSPSPVPAFVPGPAVSRPVPGQAVPGSVPSQSPVPGLSPAQPPMAGSVSSQSPVPGLTPAQSPMPGTVLSQPPVPGLALPQPPIPGTAPNQPPLPGLAPPQSSIPGTAPNQPPLPGLAPPQSSIPGTAPNQPPLPGLAPPQSPIPAPAPGQLGPIQQQSAGPGQGQFGQGLAPSTGPSPGQFAPNQAPSTGFTQAQFSQNSASNTGPTPSQTGSFQAPSTGLPQGQFGQGSATNTGPAPSTFGPIQPQSTGLGQSQFGQGLTSSTGPTPSQVGSLQSTGTGAGQGQFSPGVASNTMTPPSQFGPGQTPSMGLIPGQFPQGPAPSTGPVPSPLGTVPEQSTGLGQGQYGQSPPSNTMPAPSQVGSVQAAGAEVGQNQFGQTPASTTVPAQSQFGPVQPQQSPGLLPPSSFGQGLASGTAPATNQFGQVQTSNAGTTSGQSGLGQAPSTGYVPTPTQSPGYNPGQTPITPFVQSQTPAAGLGPNQTPNSAFTPDTTGTAGWSSA